MHGTSVICQSWHPDYVWTWYTTYTPPVWGLHRYDFWFDFRCSDFRRSQTFQIRSKVTLPTTRPSKIPWIRMCKSQNIIQNILKQLSKYLLHLRPSTSIQSSTSGDAWGLRPLGVVGCWSLIVVKKLWNIDQDVRWEWLMTRAICLIENINILPAAGSRIPFYYFTLFTEQTVSAIDLGGTSS